MEDSLIVCLQRDDEFSFQKIYNLYAFKVYRFVYKYTKQQADTEDIVQNVFIHLWKYRKTFNDDAILDAILFKTAKQEISKWYKKHKNVILEDTVLELQALENKKSCNDKEASYESGLHSIDALLQNVPSRRREIFKLNKIEEKNYKEIASEMNMSTSAVANQVSKTLKLLRKGVQKL